MATSFEQAGGLMKETGDYGGVVLGGIDPVKISEGFGVEAMDLTDESKVAETIAHGLKVIEEEKRPFLINAHLPLGLPQGGRASKQYQMEV